MKFLSLDQLLAQRERLAREIEQPDPMWELLVREGIFSAEDLAHLKCSEAFLSN
jgi:hypothetical protein